MENLLESNVVIYSQSIIMRKGLDALIRLNFPSVNILLTENSIEILSLLSVVDTRILILEVTSDRNLGIFPFIKQIKSNFSSLKILVFSEVEKPEYGLKFYKYGADCYLLKSSTEEEIKKTINNLLNKSKEDFSLKSSFSDKQYNLIDIKKLSKREMQIAMLLIKGRSNKEIGSALNLSMQTVSTYKRRILTKTETKNIVELVGFFKNTEIR